MMNKNDQAYLVQKIRTQYTEKEHTRLDALKALDRKAKRPANAFSYTFGTIAALIMGSGMSLVMTDIAAQLGLGDCMIPGIILGTAGLVMALVNYPLYKRILDVRRKKYADQIIRLSEEIMAE